MTPNTTIAGLALASITLTFLTNIQNIHISGFFVGHYCLLQQVYCREYNIYSSSNQSDRFENERRAYIFRSQQENSRKSNKVSLPKFTSVEIRFVSVGSGNQIIQFLTGFKVSQFETSMSAWLLPASLLGSLRPIEGAKFAKCTISTVYLGRFYCWQAFTSKMIFIFASNCFFTYIHFPINTG